MKRREIYADLRCLAPIIIRADGRNFRNTLLKKGFKKPYDEAFSSAMADSVKSLFKQSGLSPVLGYTFSDEISLVFFDLPFDGRVEKLNSVVSGYISSAFTLFSGIDEPVSFDSRIIPVRGFEDISEYMQWRQAEAWRNCMNSYAYHTLRQEGLGKKEANALLNGKRAPDIHELLFKRNINLDHTPIWQRRGVAVYREGYEVEGLNPLLNRKVKGQRHRIVQDWNIPLFSSKQGEAFLKRYITY